MNKLSLLAFVASKPSPYKMNIGRIIANTTSTNCYGHTSGSIGKVKRSSPRSARSKGHCQGRQGQRSLQMSRSRSAHHNTLRRRYSCMACYRCIYLWSLGFIPIQISLSNLVIISISLPHMPKIAHYVISGQSGPSIWCMLSWSVPAMCLFGKV